MTVSRPFLLILEAVNRPISIYMFDKKLSPVIGLFLFLLAQNLQAKVTLPAVISDNLVLQQNSDIKLWGWADAGEKVSVKPDWSKAVNLTTDASGKWMLSLKTPRADKKPHSIQISGKENILTD